MLNPYIPTNLDLPMFFFQRIEIKKYNLYYEIRFYCNIFLSILTIFITSLYILVLGTCKICSQNMYMCELNELIL